MAFICLYNEIPPQNSNATLIYHCRIVTATDVTTRWGTRLCRVKNDSARRQAHSFHSPCTVNQWISKELQYGVLSNYYAFSLRPTYHLSPPPQPREGPGGLVENVSSVSPAWSLKATKWGGVSESPYKKGGLVSVLGRAR